MLKSEGTNRFIAPEEVMRMVEGEHLKSTSGLIGRIKVLLETSNSIDNERNPKLGLVISKFLELADKYEDHIGRESKLIFPLFRNTTKLNVGSAPTRQQLLGQINHLKLDHKEMKQIVAEIREASGDFQPDPVSSPSLKLCFAQFFQLEQELNTHFFLEEEALYPEMIKRIQQYTKR